MRAREMLAGATHGLSVPLARAKVYELAHNPTGATTVMRSSSSTYLANRLV
jgi:hypothetical protein